MPETNQHTTGHRERLRERVLQHGAENLADYEILEGILFAARPRGDVKPMAKQLLKKFGSLNKVINADQAELMAIKGCGDSIVATLRIAGNFAERMVKDSINKKTVIIDSWFALLDYCSMAMRNRRIEEFRLIYLNERRALIRDEVVQRGTVHHTQAYPREVVKRALDAGASYLILAHNHPSGDENPSQNDIELTKYIISAAKGLGITVLDHIIIGGNKHYSFKANGLI